MRTEAELNALRKVNLGSGINQGAEYINVDLRAECEPDVVADVRKLPFPDGRFDYVYSSHTLEHISHLETRETIKEWLRVLTRAGMIKINVPNLLYAVENIDKDYGTALCVMYGAQDYELNFHKTGFTPNYLKMLLEEQGVEVTKVFTGGYDLVVEGVKK